MSPHCPGCVKLFVDLCFQVLEEPDDEGRPTIAHVRNGECPTCGSAWDVACVRPREEGSAPARDAPPSR